MKSVTRVKDWQLAQASGLAKQHHSQRRVGLAETSKSTVLNAVHSPQGIGRVFPYFEGPIISLFRLPQPCAQTAQTARYNAVVLITALPGHQGKLRVLSPHLNFPTWLHYVYTRMDDITFTALCKI